MNLAKLRHILKNRVNYFQDDIWGWELADLYVAHGKIVTNRAVPNLLNKKEVGNGVSCKRLITMLLQNDWCRTSGRGTGKRKASLERLACCVDYSGPSMMRMLAQFYSIFDANRRCFISSAVE